MKIVVDLRDLIAIIALVVFGGIYLGMLVIERVIVRIRKRKERKDK